MSEHLAPLIVVVPLLSAPMCILAGERRLAWLVAMLATLFALGCSIGLNLQVMADGPISYHMGGWAPPLGIEYRIDALSAMVTLIVTGVGAVVLLYTPGSLATELPLDRHYMYYALHMLCGTGLVGMTVTGDAFNVFVFLEISSLSAYVLIALGKDRRALVAAFQYLVMGAVGGTFILIGIGLMYMMTGTLNMGDLAARLPPVLHTRTLMVAFAFMTVGASLKLALFPLHFWLPNAYAYAPSSVSAFISATATKVMVYVFVRFTFTMFGKDFAFGTLGVGNALMALALMGIYTMSTVAIFQNNVKRLLAYSSVAQIGYMILGVALATQAGLAACFVHLFNHALMKGGLFLAVGNVARQTGSVELEAFKGLGRRMPLTMAAFVVGGMGLIGVPLTVGFVSKWMLLTAILEDGSWPIAAAALVSSLLAVVYVWRVVEVAYFQEPDPERADTVEVGFSQLLPTWILIGASVFFGVNTSWSAGLAAAAAASLLGGTP